MRLQHSQWPKSDTKWPQQAVRQRKKHRERIRHFISQSVHERTALGIALRRASLKVLDTGMDQELDALVKAVAAVCGGLISLISFIDAQRQWFKANIGVPAVCETPRDLASVRTPRWQLDRRLLHVGTGTTSRATC